MVGTSGPDFDAWRSLLEFVVARMPAHVKPAAGVGASARAVARSILSSSQCRVGRFRQAFLSKIRAKLDLGRLCRQPPVRTSLHKPHASKVGIIRRSA